MTSTIAAGPQPNGAMLAAAHVVGQLAGPSDKRQAAEKIVERHALYSTSGLLVPLPFVDLAAATASNTLMLGKLAELYGAKAEDGRARRLVASLVGGIAPLGLTAAAGAGALGVAGLFGLGTGAARFLPVLGAPLLAYVAFVTTRTLGRVFIEHFEAGGTLLDFDPELHQARFQERFERAWREHAPADATMAVPPDPTGGTAAGPRPSGPSQAAVGPRELEAQAVADATAPGPSRVTKRAVRPRRPSSPSGEQVGVAAEPGAPRSRGPVGPRAKPAP